MTQQPTQTQMKYTDSRYTFTNPIRTHKGERCGVRRYVKYLEQIAKCNANGFEPTRKQVQIALGDPDPTRITAQGAWGKQRSNWGCSRWAAMRQAGLIRSKREGNAVRYQITAQGVLLLHSVL